MKCFDCHEVMWRKPLPAPRDSQVQHRCKGKVVTRKFDLKCKNCKKRHKKSKLNPNGVCLVIITKEQYLSQPNDGRYALMLSESTSKEKKQRVGPSRRRAVKAKVTRKLIVLRRRRAVKAKVTTKQRTRAKVTVKRKTGVKVTAKQRIGVRVKTTIRLPPSRRIAREKKAISGRQTKKRKRTTKRKTCKTVSIAPMKAMLAAALVKRQLSERPKQEVTAVKSTKESQLTKIKQGIQAEGHGSSCNPITLDSDEEKSKWNVRVPVDDIRIGEFSCKRTRFDYPSLQCFEKLLTLYVWDKKRNDDDEREGKESFEVDIPYSKLTYASFNKCNKFCYCVFETSANLLERRPNEIHGKGDSLEGKFIHNAHNMQKRSILVASVREDEIVRIRKQFLK